MLAPHATKGSGRTSTNLLDKSGPGLERMPGLGRVLNVFADEAPAALEPLLGRPPKVSVQPIDTTSAREAYLKGTGIYELPISCVEPDVRFFLLLHEPHMDLVLANIFGIDPTTLRHRSSGNYTKVELGLLKELAQIVASQFCLAFGQPLSSGCTMGGLQPRADADIVARREQPAFALDISLSQRSGTATLRLLFPQAFLQVFHTQLATGLEAKASPTDPLWQQRIVSGVSKTRLPVIAVLEEVETTLGAVAALRAGDVLHLRGARFGQVRLECAERGVFAGRLLQGNDGYSIQIETPIVEEDGVGSLIANSSEPPSNPNGP